jgi:hypothetical protein
MPLKPLTDLMASKKELGQSSNQKKPLIFGQGPAHYVFDVRNRTHQAMS